MIQENTPAKVGLVELAAESLMQDLRQIIEQARNRVAYTANSELTMMYWHIGERINREVLENERAEYGKQIVTTVSTQLQTEYGRKGFEPRSIWRMMQFAQEFPDDFMFQLTNEEWNILRSQIVTAKQSESKAITLLRSQFVTAKDISKIRTLPYAFTREGIGMLSSVSMTRCTSWGQA